MRERVASSTNGGPGYKSKKIWKISNATESISVHRSPTKCNFDELENKLSLKYMDNEAVSVNQWSLISRFIESLS